MRPPAALAAAARSLLFVPGDRPDRYGKAVSSGPDLVILDLEDAVAPVAKDAARAHVAAALETPQPYVVRINAADTEWWQADVELVTRYRCCVMLPKAESLDSLAELTGRLPDGSAVIALLETARGVLAAADVAAAPGVVRLALGTFDLAAELMVAPEDQAAMAAARGQLVLASAAAGLPGPVDGVTGNIRDEARLRADLEHARRLGFAGKLCIHPFQVPVVAELMRPDPAQLAWARGVLAADADARARGASVAVAHGAMVDKPVLDRARRLLEQIEDSRYLSDSGQDGKVSG